MSIRFKLFKPARHLFAAGLAAWVLCAVVPVQEAVARDHAYVEDMPKRGFHLFVRPKKKTAAAQWDYVQSLERSGNLKGASQQALALRLFYPLSDEAPMAQLFHARAEQARGRLESAFEAYDYLVEHFNGRFDFDDVLTQQFEIAKALMTLKKGKFLFLPGFQAPDRAIPYFERIVKAAPEWRHTPEAQYLIGVAYESIYEYANAVSAFTLTENRFPKSEFAEQAAYAKTRCYLTLANDAPNDNRALENARAAKLLFLKKYPDSQFAGQARADVATLRLRQGQNAYERAKYYDQIAKNPKAAILEYETFLEEFSDSPWAEAARVRIQFLQASRKETP